MGLVLKKTIGQIKAYIKALDREDQYALIPELLSDRRTGVRALGKGIQNTLRKKTLEAERINRMKGIENDLRREGFNAIAGIDEAGRGPLSGPVVAAAVILPGDLFIPGIRDSKQISPGIREELYHRITKEAVAYGIGMADNREIDRINILRATYKAVYIALKRLTIKPDCLLLDALKLPRCDVYQKSIIKGDDKCLSIAAASIIAKVVRDRYMNFLDYRYPKYNFRRNKGYGTEEHRLALLKHGPCPVHRDTFLENIRRQAKWN